MNIMGILEHIMQWFPVSRQWLKIQASRAGFVKELYGFEEQSRWCFARAWMPPVKVLSRNGQIRPELSEKFIQDWVLVIDRLQPVHSSDWIVVTHGEQLIVRQVSTPETLDLADERMIGVVVNWQPALGNKIYH